MASATVAYASSLPLTTPKAASCRQPPSCVHPLSCKPDDGIPESSSRPGVAARLVTCTTLAITVTALAVAVACPPAVMAVVAPIDGNTVTMGMVIPIPDRHMWLPSKPSGSHGAPAVASCPAWLPAGTDLQRILPGAREPPKPFLRKGHHWFASMPLNSTPDNLSVAEKNRIILGILIDLAQQGKSNCFTL